MPIYEYSCDKCGLSKEVIQKIGEEAPDCPKCGGGMIKKPSSPAIVRIFGEGGYPIRSKGYKEGYSKEYLKDVPEA